MTGMEMGMDRPQPEIPSDFEFTLADVFLKALQLHMQQAILPRHAWCFPFLLDGTSSTHEIASWIVA